MTGNVYTVCSVSTNRSDTIDIVVGNPKRTDLDDWESRGISVRATTIADAWPIGDYVPASLIRVVLAAHDAGKRWTVAKMLGVSRDVWTLHVYPADRTAHVPHGYPRPAGYPLEMTWIDGSYSRGYGPSLRDARAWCATESSPM